MGDTQPPEVMRQGGDLPQEAAVHKAAVIRKDSRLDAGDLAHALSPFRAHVFIQGHPGPAVTASGQA